MCVGPSFTQQLRVEALKMQMFESNYKNICENCNIMHMCITSL